MSRPLPSRRTLAGRLAGAERLVQESSYMLGLYPDSAMWQRVHASNVFERDALADRVAKRRPATEVAS